MHVQRPLCAVQSAVPASCHSSAEEAAERILYVYGCTEEGCGVQSGSWRAWTLHVDPSKATADKRPAQPPLVAAPPAAEEWGMDSSDWGGEARSCSGPQEEPDLSDLQAGLDSLMLSPSNYEQVWR